MNIKSPEKIEQNSNISIKEIGDKLTEIIKNPQHRDMLSSALTGLIYFAEASQKKTISLQAKNAIKIIYDLIKK